MTNKEKLINLLCTVDEIKKDIMEVRLGTIIEYTLFGKYDRIAQYIVTRHRGYSTKISLTNEYDDYGDFLDCIKYEEGCEFKIIGNKLEERHLRMFAEKK